MKEIKLVITEPFINGPSWLIENPGLEIIIISGESSLAEVDAALYKTLFYNDIPITDNPSESLELLMKEMDEQESIVTGGLLFRVDDKVIEPGCCCGLEQWREVVNHLRQGRRPWLGHDPIRGCEFLEDSICIISDNLEEYPKERESRQKKQYKLEYSKAEMEALLIQLEKDRDDFINGPLKKRLDELVPEIADKFCEAWRKNF